MIRNTELSGTSITVATCEFLEKTCGELGRKLNILEFGTGAGKATRILANHAKLLVTMDHDPVCTQYTKDNFGTPDNVIYYSNYNPDNVKGLKFDLVFIDGPPGGKKREETFPKFWGNVKPGALILLDDSNRGTEKEALKKWSSDLGFEYEILKVGRGIGKFYKPGVEQIALLCNTKMFGGGERSVLKLLEMMESTGLEVQCFTLTPDAPINKNMAVFSKDWRTCDLKKQIFVMNDKIYRLQNEEFLDFLTVLNKAEDVRFIINFVNGGLSKKTWLAGFPMKKVVFLNSEKERAWKKDAHECNSLLQTAVLPPPVDIDKFLNFPKGFRKVPRVVGSHGGKSAKDSVAIYEKLADSNKDISLHFLPGHPRLKSALNPHRCKFLPKTDSVDDVISFLSLLDVYVYHLEPGHHTQGPRTVIEAMAMGLPIVTDSCKDCGMSSRVIHGVTGFLCDDKEDIVQAVHTLLHDSKLRYRMGKAAREAAREMRPEKWLDHLL